MCWPNKMLLAQLHSESDPATKEKPKVASAHVEVLDFAW